MPFATIMIVTGIVAGACVGGIPIWILGIPGVDGAYARGWKMGFTALFLYPLAWLASSAPYFFARHHLGDAARTQWQRVTGILALIFFLLLVLRLIQAFRTMRQTP